MSKLYWETRGGPPHQGGLTTTGYPIDKLVDCKRHDKCGNYVHPGVTTSGLCMSCLEERLKLAEAVLDAHGNRHPRAVLRCYDEWQAFLDEQEKK